MGIAAAFAAIGALAAPGMARAQVAPQVVQLDGSPLDVFVDGLGALQVRFDGQPADDQHGEFYGAADQPSDDGLEVRSGNADAGYFISRPGDEATRTATQQPAVSGPAGGTRTVTSAYDVKTLNNDGNPDVLLHVAETLQYTDGAPDVRIEYAITNKGDGAASFSAGELADLYVGGSDEGVGVFDPGPPRFVGGTGDIGGQDGLLEATPWSRYEEDYYGTVFDDFESGGLKNTILTEDEDNGVGVEWVVDGLAPGDTRTIDAIWRFDVSGAPQISDAPVSGTTVTLSGTAQPGDAITIYERGAPVGSPTTADQNGRWAVTLTNVAPGTHEYTAVATGAGGTSASLPRSVTVASTPAVTPAATPTPTPTPTVTPAPLPPPVVGKTVNAQTKSGTVKIKLPGTNTFVDLGPGQQVPTGTIIDTTHGRITLTSAVGGGRTEHADFYKGIFKVTQTHGRKPLTQLSLSGPKPTCTTRGRKAHASAARKGKKKVKSRSLWGSGHGAFRTKGQYSSATVRGTTWLTQDTCAGTLTRVTSGVVQVQDFVRHKKVLVRAGHRYLARAKRH